MIIMLKAQQFKCEISKDNFHTQEFPPLLDTIVPTKGHMRGNLRIICCFLNSTNTDKKKKKAGAVRSTIRTSEMFYPYIGIEAYEQINMNQKNTESKSRKV